ncbi:SusD/RagB family nutrient-binding outer membrane lipoprotein [Niabella ginsengisoli]|uniref:SusD/RagB family nutrient-binding outer membrane lipoprotein n=1 Tax=Niabella ginsengisoli TaxID=522298 RepID=A0ABS9SJN5_9BACT|nr:SusD/RagB family nutrient-binding outer membrane lipoprotein [Niabella ginsengisoli]MCH5598576.1 SusD/RagB family nutrient-binding outer membrane lipoprotein [Niabella ginsengisoli]
MKKIQLIIRPLITMLTVMMIFASCQKKLDNLFPNPDAFTSVQIEYVLPTAINNTLRVPYGDVYTYHIGKFGPMLQNMAFNSDPVSGDYYNIRSDLGAWGAYYTQKMNNLKGIEYIYSQLPIEEQEGYKVYLPIVKILEAYATAQATDVYDDMPYSEAFTGISIIFGGTGANLTPKFDPQSEIYYAMLADLKQAAADLSSITLQAAQYDAHRVLPAQDILFGGNLSKWVKFANSLRLRYAMRISEADPARAKMEVQDLITSNAPLIMSNADNAVQTSGPNANGTGGAGQTYVRALWERQANLYAPKVMVDSMKSATDPRLLVMYVVPGQASASTYTNYEGLPGSFDARTGLDLTRIAKFDSVAFVQNGNLLSGVAINASDVQFLLAEAYFKGIAGAAPDMVKARQYYEDGMKLSVEFYYNIYINSSLTSRRRITAQPSASAVAAMIASPAYAFNGAKFMEQLAIQKWIHFSFLEMDESYAEFRRLDALKLPVDIFQGQNVTRFPVRYEYPTSESSSNAANYSAVSAKDNDNTKVWWDKN